MDTKIMLEEGRMLRQTDRWSAIDYYERQRQKAAVSQDRELWLDSSLTLAWELLESGQNDQGIIAQTSTLASPDYPYFVLAQARLLIAEGDFESPLALPPTTTDDNELQGLIADALAQCLSLSHQFDRARPQFDRALALLSPDSFYLGFVHLHRGEMHLFMQNFDHSEEDAQSALEIALETEDQLLRFHALVLLAKISLRRDRGEVVPALIEDAQTLIDPEIDTLEVVILLLLQLETLSKEGETATALTLAEHLPDRLADVQDWRLKTQARHLEGKLGIGKITEGLINLSEETIEDLEDIFLEVALDYEERKMYSCQAQVLLDIAHLYYFAQKLPTPYQFQGKSLRSIEQAGEILKQIGLNHTPLGQEIEQLYDQVLDRSGFM